MEVNEEEPKNKEKYAKYKEMFDKYKNHNNMLSEVEVNDILNECGRKTTLKESEELIKKINGDKDRSTIDFSNFVKLMDTSNIDSLDPTPKDNSLSNCQIYFFMLLLLITGSINTTANKLQQSTVSLDIKYSGHQKFITFCMFNGELICLLIYWIKEGRKKKPKSETLIEEGKEEQNQKKKPKIWYFLQFLIY